MTPAVRTMPIVTATARWILELPDGRVRVCDDTAAVWDAAAADAPGAAIRFVGHTTPPTSPLRPCGAADQLSRSVASAGAPLGASPSRSGRTSAAG